MKVLIAIAILMFGVQVCSAQTGPEINPNGIIFPKLPVAPFPILSTKGQVIYNTTFSKFQTFNGSTWVDLVEIPSGLVSSIKDDDGDSQIKFGESFTSLDPDEIIFETDSSRTLHIQKTVGDHTRISYPTTSTYIGFGAGLKARSDANNNVAIGYQAGRDNVAGDNNVYIGNEAGRNLAGRGNVALGYKAGPSQRNGNPLNASNRLYINNDEDNTPLIYGEFDDEMVTINGSLDADELTADNLQGTSSNQPVYADSDGKLTLTSPLNWYMVTPSEFRTDDWNGLNFDMNADRMCIDRDISEVYVPLHLPHGVTIERIVVTYYDNSLGSLHLRMRQSQPTQSIPPSNVPWTFDSSGESNSRRVSRSTGLNIDVDNENERFYIFGNYNPNSFGFGTDGCVYGIAIGYRYK